MKDPSIERRKSEHLALAARDEVEAPGGSTLLEEVSLVHEALPERAAADVDLTTTLLGRRLRTPFVAVGMTGGTLQAREVNRAVAAGAQAVGAAFGLGSMRPLFLDPALLPTYAVRDVAPDVLLFGNVGAWQLEELGSDGCRRLCDRIGADALCVHLNAAQELAQPEGDRDFSGALRRIEQLCAALGRPVIAKETGCGVSPSTARRLKDAGVALLDVAGAGGTSWPKIEALRASDATVGEALAGWGIPTAASVLCCAPLGLPLIASGGIRTGLDAARALALGAAAVGLARPLLLAAQAGGAQEVTRCLHRLETSLRAIVVLTGAGSLGELRGKPRVLGPSLLRWQEALRA